MKGWTCQRQAKGKACRHKNPTRKRKCQKCGKTRRARYKPSHLTALNFSYEEYAEMNGGNHCAICGRPPSATRRLDRDHCHATGQPRGLLCSRCNRALPSWTSPEWLRDAATYLERSIPT